MADNDLIKECIDTNNFDKIKTIEIDEDILIKILIYSLCENNTGMFKFVLNKNNINFVSMYQKKYQKKQTVLNEYQCISCFYKNCNKCNTIMNIIQDDFIENLKFVDILYNNNPKYLNYFKLKNKKIYFLYRDIIVAFDDTSIVEDKTEFKTFLTSKICEPKLNTLIYQFLI